MDNIRFLLILVFSFLVFMLWGAWQQDYGPKPESQVVEQNGTLETGEELPVATAVDANKTDTVTANENTVSAIPKVDTASNQVITVTTDVIGLEINTKGGTLQNLDLLGYPKYSTQQDEGWLELIKETFNFSWLPVQKHQDYDKRIRLLNTDKEKLFLAQSGFTGSSDLAPNHYSQFSTEYESYQMQPDQNILKVPLTWTNGNGIEVTKTFVFERGSFLIKQEQEVVNNSLENWSARQYNQLIRRSFEEEGNKSFIRTYQGGVLYTEEEKYEKIDYDDMTEENLSVSATGGWSAMIQHYFASAWIPPKDEENHFYTKALSAENPNDWRFVIGSYSQNVNIAPSEQTTIKSELYAGPKIQPKMEKIATGLELTVDYGFLTFIGKPIFWLLNSIYNMVGNWGIAIMGVTLIIKALFFPLSNTSYRSMAKMRKIQPKLQQLKEQYGDDKQRFNTEMMAMYKKEKVNPLGGCFPILVQIPVFISLYWVLIETVELRQAPFALWLVDLSVQDPYFVLPVLMGITMKLQQMLNPPPLDPIQAKVIKMFPLVFTVFFLFFPSGLVLYWVCNNSLSFAQQWYITRNIEREQAVVG